MGDNAQKTPVAVSLNRFAEKKVLDAIQLLGKALPCSVTKVEGSIVTVKFEVTAAPFTLPNVKCPVAGPEYVRVPIQTECKGVVFPASVSLGGVSGLGSGAPKIAETPANLGSLVFFPIGNSAWQAPIDPNKIEIWGPGGAIVRNEDGSCSVLITDNTAIIEGTTHATLKCGANSVDVTPTAIIFNGPVQFNGTVTAYSGGNINFGGSNLTNVGNIGAQAITGTNITEGTIRLGTHKHTASGGIIVGGPTP